MPGQINIAHTEFSLGDMMAMLFPGGTDVISASNTGDGTDGPATQRVSARSLVVTGASSGIGFAVTQLLIESGCEVLACLGRGAHDRSEVGLLNDMPGCTCVNVDLDDADNCEDNLLRLLDRNPQWEGVVNVAGVATLGSIEHMSDRALATAFRVNVIAPMTIIARLLPRMRQRRRGLVLNVSSGAAVCPLPFGGIYSATKSALESATFALHQEVSGFGIRVCALRLGKVSGTRLGRTPVERGIGEAYRPVHDRAKDRIYRHIWPDDAIWPSPHEVAKVIERIALSAEAPLVIEQFGQDLETASALSATLWPVAS